jgi:hypothetical protein
MVKKLSKFLGYTLFFILSLIYFTPKVAFYYLAEEELNKFEVIISNEKVFDSGFSLELTDLNVYVKSIESASIKELDVKIFGFYNKIMLQNIVLTDTASSFVPLNISFIEASYTIFDPLNVKATASGDFGELDVTFNLLEMLLNVKLLPSDVMKKKYRSTMSQLSKNEDGSYSYDKNF